LKVLFQGRASTFANYGLIWTSAVLNVSTMLSGKKFAARMVFLDIQSFLLGKEQVL